jgi:hypothetical protein
MASRSHADTLAHATESRDRITRIVCLGVPLATTEDCCEDKNPSLINGVASLPSGTPVALELIFEVG